jgi:hypothetical protein
MPLTDLRAGYDSLHRDAGTVSRRNMRAIARGRQGHDDRDQRQPARRPGAARHHHHHHAGDRHHHGRRRRHPEAFLKRTDKPAVAPAEPTPSAFDEPRWLAELTRAFEDCGDVATLGARQVELMLSKRKSVTATAWKKAEKLARTAFDRLMNQAERTRLFRLRRSEGIAAPRSVRWPAGPGAPESSGPAAPEFSRIRIDP